jgi:spermidine/putrescine transport system substrate-binding protein
MSNKRFVLLSLMVSLLAVILFSGGVGQATAQSAATAAAATPVATLPPKNGKPQELHVYNYTTYIADDTVANFEKLYNVKVTYDTYTKPEELYAKIQAGNPGYDVVVPPDYMVRQMIKANLLEPLNMANIPNFAKNASERFKNPPYDPGNKYSVAYQWGTIGLGYNPAKVKGGKMDSWLDLFDEAKVGKGRVALLLATRETIATYLIALGKDANSTKKEDLDAVKAFLIKNKDFIAAFHDADGQFKLAKGEVDAISDWSGDMFQVIGDPANKDLGLVYTIPKEGAVLWTDNLVIPKGAPNKPLAELFINYIYDAQVGANISNAVQYGSPNQAAIDQKLISADMLANPAVYPPKEVADKLQILGDIGDAQALYDQTWADIVAAVSK